jgi:hypothetical protein
VRLRLAATAGAALGALTIATPALAHVTVKPPFLATGEKVSLTLDVPNERDGHPMTVFSLHVPDGMRVTGGETRNGWIPSVEGQNIRWRGGSLAPTATTTFVAHVVGPDYTGTAELFATQGYDDGAETSWPIAMTITPSETSTAGGDKQNLGTALLVGAVGLFLILGSLLVLRRYRTRPLQER